VLVKSGEEQDPSDDLAHEPEAQPKTVTAAAHSGDHPTGPPNPNERLPLLILRCRRTSEAARADLRLAQRQLDRSAPSIDSRMVIQVHAFRRWRR
jgi:hypothetical protein